MRIASVMQGTRRGAAALALCCGAAASAGQPTAAGRPGGGAAAAGPPAMPDAVALAVRIEDGAAWRAHGPTKRLAAILMGAGAPERVRAAWSELSGTLGMEDGPAFDALLGRSMVFCLADEARWGVLGAASAASVRTLETRLDPAPRGFEDGRAVMLVERGKFRLTKLAGETEGTWRMVLTPGETAEPIDLTARAAGALEGAGKRGVSWFWRPEEGGGSLSGTASMEERGWKVEFRGDATVLGMTAEGCRTIAKQAGEADGLEAGALLEVAARAPGEAPGLGRRTKEMAALLAAARVTTPAAGLLGSGFVVRAARPAGVRAAAGLDVLLACEVKSRAEASPAFDSMMVGILDLAWRMSAEPGGAKNRDFRQEIERAKDDPGAVRLVVLGAPKDASAGGTLAWTTVGGAEGSAGWWVAQFTPGSAGRDEAERSLREQAARVAARRWGSVLLRAGVRPAELWKAAGEAGAAFKSGPAAALRELERVELTVRAAGDGVAGEARAETAAEEPRRP